MQIGDMTTLIKRNGFEDSDPLYFWIVAALHDFEKYYRWPFLRSTLFVSTAPSLNVVGVTNASRISSVRHRDEALVLTEISRQVYEEETFDPETTGKPTNWIFEDTYGDDPNVQLWPVPDDVYRLRIVYYKKIQEPSNTPTAVPQIPTTFHFNICQLAIAFGHDADNNEDRAQTFKDQAYAGFDAGISSFYGSNNAFSQVRDTQGYED